MGSRVARWDLDDDAEMTYSAAWLAGTTGNSFKPGASSKRYRAPGKLLATGAAAVMLAMLALLPTTWRAISGVSVDLPLTRQSNASDTRPTALAGTLGPESLPLTVAPVQGNPAHADRDTEHGLRSDSEDAAQTEALKP